MKIYELLRNAENIFCLSKVPDYNNLFSIIIPTSLNLKDGKTISREKIIQKILEREELGPTADKGIAIPHARLTDLEEPICRLAIIKNAINSHSIDEAPSNIIFLILTPDDNGDIYIQILQRVAFFCKRRTLLSQLKQKSSPEEVFELLKCENF